MKNLFLSCLSFFIVSACYAQVVVYPSPVTNFSKVSNMYVVSVTQGGVTHQSFVYQSIAGTGPHSEWGQEINNNFHFTDFSFSGSVVVNVTKIGSSATSAVIRPNTLGIGTKTTTTSGSNKTVSFTLNTTSKVSVEFNDDPTFANVLMIYADPLEISTNVPNISASNVLVATSATTASSLATMPSGKTIVYFPPGVYSLGGRWTIPSTVTQVYIAGGAYVMGYLYWNLARYTNPGLKINGRGIISNEGFAFHYPSTAADQNSKDYYNPIYMNGGVNDMIEGINIIESTGYNLYIIADNMTVDNVKVHGFRYNNDGITPHGNGCIIKNCFFSVNDDGIVPSVNNLTVTNCIFWELQGGTIQLGWTPHTQSNISITNCEILHDKAAAVNTNGDVGFINAMNVTATSAATDINNVTISNITFDTPVLRFIDIRGDRPSNTAVFPYPWVYRNFKISNISFAQAGTTTYPLIYLHGYDVNHPLTGYTIQNIKVSGAVVSPTSLLVPVINVADKTLLNPKYLSQ